MEQRNSFGVAIEKLSTAQTERSSVESRRFLPRRSLTWSSITSAHRDVEKRHDPQRDPLSPARERGLFRGSSFDGSRLAVSDSTWRTEQDGKWNAVGRHFRRRREERRANALSFVIWVTWRREKSLGRNIFQERSLFARDQRRHERDRQNRDNRYSEIFKSTIAFRRPRYFLNDFIQLRSSVHLFICLYVWFKSDNSNLANYPIVLKLCRQAQFG